MSAKKHDREMSNRTTKNHNSKGLSKRRKPGRRQYSNTLSLIKTFLITFAAVVALGSLVLVVIALPRYLKKHKHEPINIVDFVETIPQTIMEEVTSTSVEEETMPVEEVDTTKYGNVINDEEYLLANNIFVKEASEDGIVSLGFSGDILLDDQYAVMCALIQRGNVLSKGIFPELLEEMNSVDVMVVNNEFPFTDRGTRQENKQFTFQADCDTVKYLNEMGADVAVLANNHVFDYGEQGLLDTLDTLESANIHPVGAGHNFAEASRPVYYIINDIKIAIVASTQIERMNNPNTKGATEDSPGVFRCWNDDRIYAALSEAKANADFVIACIHWGTEKMEQPDEYQLKMAPKLAEAGADLIIGDHTHRLQGIYYYGDVPCVYSLGNFWFNGYTMDTELVRVTIDKDGLKELKIIPAVQENFSTHIAKESEKSRIINYLRTLSKGADISDDGYVTRNG